MGFAIAPDLIVTGASACDGATEIEIETIDGSFFKAEILRSDQGLTLLKAKDAKLASLPLAPTATNGALTLPGLSQMWHYLTPSPSN